MIGIKQKKKGVSDRRTLWRRIRKMYASFNRGMAEDCFSLVDPKLIDQGKVELSAYVDGLATFKKAYGSVRLFHVRISLHLDASKNKHDPRPFAYVYVTWQDESHRFHMFRERWVKHAGRWFTRVAGLVTNKTPVE